MPTFCMKAVDHEFFNTDGNSAKSYGWTAKTANIGAAIRHSLIHIHSWCERYDSKIKWLLVLNFPRKQCYGSKKWRWLFHWKNFNPSDPFLERIFQISRCWTRRLLLLWTRSFRIPSSRRSSVSRSRKDQKEYRFLSRKTDRLHDDNLLEFDTRWDEVLLSMLRIRESAQLETVLELYDIGIHQKITMPNYHKLKTMVKRSIDQTLRLRNFDARRGRLETGAVIKSRKGMSGVEGVTGSCYQWKKASVRRETSGVSRMRVTSVHNKNRIQMPPHLLSHQCHEVEVCRGNEVSEAKVTLVRPTFRDDREQKPPRPK